VALFQTTRTFLPTPPRDPEGYGLPAVTTLSVRTVPDRAATLRRGTIAVDADAPPWCPNPGPPVACREKEPDHS
jgi:hypothetical protein